MFVRYILGGLAVVFLILAGTRLVRDRGRMGPAARTWLLIGLIFAVISISLASSATFRYLRP
jgi:hypothetical protein